MKDYLNLIKFPHTVFALPFAFLGFFIGIHEEGSGVSMKIFFLVLLCMIFARSAAMAFNRFLDKDIDSLNIRTKQREIPSGKISASGALAFTVLNSAAFVICCYFINRLCFILSPVALFVVLGYSYTKRFTIYCHLILGLGLALAPLGAFLAVYPHIALLPVLYGMTVLFWVGGFDIIYALQDEEFDKNLKLFSMPAFFGKVKALRISEVFHFISSMVILLSAFLMMQKFTEMYWLHWLGALAFVIMVAYQHTLVKINDLSKVNLAFFTFNGIASIVFCSLVILDFYL